MLFRNGFFQFDEATRWIFVCLFFFFFFFSFFSFFLHFATSLPLGHSIEEKTFQKMTEEFGYKFETRIPYPKEYAEMVRTTMEVDKV